ncbi:hypothetical protein T11_16639 [Trichinella zimbabwensis]|uniref:Uncharacterized protein n=1 Tax=Trichinella zimbabwensis TaxID=268475 RepID=A0A0V1HE36_9BILA|nr:hypothetical protein T11_16639 [Trichinella zimbabwensis]
MNRPRRPPLAFLTHIWTLRNLVPTSGKKQTPPFERRIDEAQRASSMTKGEDCADLKALNQKSELPNRIAHSSPLKMMHERIHICHSGSSFYCISKQAFKTAAPSALSIFEVYDAVQATALPCVEFLHFKSMLHRIMLKRGKKANDAFSFSHARSHASF